MAQALRDMALGTSLVRVPGDHLGPSGPCNLATAVWLGQPGLIGQEARGQRPEARGQSPESRGTKEKRVQLWPQASGLSLPHSLEHNPLRPLTVPFSIEHTLPGTEIQLAVGYRDNHLVPYRQRAQMCRGVVLAGS